MAAMYCARGSMAVMFSTFVALLSSVTAPIRLFPSSNFKPRRRRCCDCCRLSDGSGGDRRVLVISGSLITPLHRLFSLFWSQVFTVMLFVFYVHITTVAGFHFGTLGHGRARL